MSKIFIYLVRFYQKFISTLTPPTCRYYPTCSEYAIWQLKHQNIFVAIFYIFKRIITCNQWFDCGIDYPKIRRKKLSNLLLKSMRIKIRFWLVPCGVDLYYIIKVIDFK